MFAVVELRIAIKISRSIFFGLVKLCFLELKSSIFSLLLFCLVFCPTIFDIKATRFLLNWANNGNNQRQYGECVSTSNSHFQR